MKSDQKEVYQCKIFSVHEEKVPLPDGRSVKQSWIDHKPTVAVVAVNNENKVLLIKQYRAAVKNHLLEIPAGTMDREGESPVVCAQRELAEETGFKARYLKAICFPDTAMNICIFSSLKIFFMSPCLQMMMNSSKFCLPVLLWLKNC
jgi:ADP-ribose pyrophosphatase